MDQNELIAQIIMALSKNNSWSDQDEGSYRQWLYEWSKNTGVDYDPNDKYYDYRKAYKLNLSPTWQEEHGDFRWPDVGKSPDYPKSYEHGMPYLIWDKLFGGYNT